MAIRLEGMGGIPTAPVSSRIRIRLEVSETSPFET